MAEGVYSRREAQSGRIDYCTPFILSETSRTKLTAIPFFIQHSDHSELALKIQTTRKASPPDNWFEIEEKTISLSSDATRILASELPKLAMVAKEESSGDYIVIKASDGTANLDELDPGEVTDALLTVLGQDSIVSHLQGRNLSSKLVEAIKYSVRLEEMKIAMAELREYLNSGNNLESTYQGWCERHPWAFGNQFIVNDEIRNITIQDSVDILMPRIIAGFRDIVELKRPDKEVLNYDETHKDYYFSAEVSKAIGQCHRYLDVFSQAAANGLLGHEQIVAYHPEATIVIGRSFGWDSAKIKALHGLNSRLSGIGIITYDHLLAQGESLVDYLSGYETVDGEDCFDDIPF